MGPDPDPAAGDRPHLEALGPVGSRRRSQAAGEERISEEAARPFRQPSVSSCNSSSSDEDNSFTWEAEACQGRMSLLQSPRGSEGGTISSRGEKSAAYAVAAQLRWLALRVRGLEREAAGSDAAWVPPSPRSPRVSSSAGKDATPAAAAAAAGGLPSKLQKLMRKVAVSLEFLSEEANHAAAEVRDCGPPVSCWQLSPHGVSSPLPVSSGCLQSCSWSSTAARQKQQLQQALEENERLLSENQALAGELSECRAKYLNSERQRQQLLHCKQFQEKFLACQRQIGLLQHDLQTLHQTFEALEASHKAQETQLQQNAQTEARLKEALRTTAEQLAQAKQALTVERASARAAQIERVGPREEMVLLPQRTLSYGRLFAGQQQQQAQQQQQQQEQQQQQQDSRIERSSSTFVAAATRSAPQPCRSLSMSRHSVLRCHLKTSIVQRQQQQQQQQQKQQQAAPLPPSSGLCRKAREGPLGDNKAGDEERSSSNLSSSSSSAAVGSEQDIAETAASTFRREGASGSVSLFEELVATAAGSNLLKPSCKAGAAAAAAVAAGDGKGDNSKPIGAPLQQQPQASSEASPFTPKRTIPVSTQCAARDTRSCDSSSATGSSCCCCCCCAASACTDSKIGVVEGFLWGPLVSPLSFEETIKLLLHSACRSWRVAVEASKGISLRPYPESLWALLLLSSAAAAAAMAAWVHLGQRRHQTQEGLA
ncbi:hypothetical protein Emag_000098 [Eimeria magna]